MPFRGSFTFESCNARREWLEAQAGKPLNMLSQWYDQDGFGPENLSHNVENLIGLLQIPVGVAGPLLFHGKHTRGLIPCAIATSEGALVASISRGALALTKAGGVQVQAVESRMQRVPAFMMRSRSECEDILQYILDHKEDMLSEITATSKHAQLVELNPLILDNVLHLEFNYTTGDAAGQNMTTACTKAACNWILERFPKALPHVELQLFMVEGQGASDKKPCTLRAHGRTRGTRVTAEATIPCAVFENVLKVNPSKWLEGLQITQRMSSHMGMLGNCINVANVVGGVFTACGQDIASVHESSVGMLEASMTKDSTALHVRMTLPSLLVGSVGGGTALPAQQQILQMMGCAGQGGKMQLAEIIAGYALALDLSTLAAIVSRQFASAHEKLGRNRPPPAKL